MNRKKLLFFVTIGWFVYPLCYMGQLIGRLYHWEMTDQEWAERCANDF